MNGPQRDEWSRATRLDHHLSIPPIVAVVIVTMATVVAPDAAAQYGYGSYSQQGHPTPTTSLSRRSAGFRFSDEQPIVGRTVVGLGWSFGSVEGAGWNAEGALSFRLESARSYGGFSRHLYLMPEVGFSYIQHGPADALFNDSEQSPDEQPVHHLFFGLVGLRAGWGNTDRADVYVLTRFLMGSHLAGAVAYGTMAGVGVEFYHGVFGLEVAHLWTYVEALGHVQGIRASVNLDFIRVISLAIRWIVRAGGLPAQA